MVRTRRGATISSASTVDEDEKEVEEKVNMSASDIQNAIALAAEAASKTFGWKKHQNTNSSPKTTQKHENPLSELIPGYIAPMALDSSGLDVYKKKKIGTMKYNPATVVASSGGSFKKGKHISLKSDTNAGNGWFGMESSNNSEEIQNDIAIIRNRNYLDPKKFYKSSDFSKGKSNKVVQLGTVIEGAMESIYSNRLTKKQRKSTLLEEVMEDVYSKDGYVKKKFTNMQRERSEKGKVHKRRRSNKKGKMGRR